MRASTDFLLREIAGEFMLVPVGPGASGINGLVTLNEIGAFLFKALQTDQSLDSLTAAVVSEYDVPPETARADAADFLRKVRELGFAVKLDTNGTNPDMLEALAQESSRSPAQLGKGA